MLIIKNVTEATIIYTVCIYIYIYIYIYIILFNVSLSSSEVISHPPAAVSFMRKLAGKGSQSGLFF